MTNDELKASLQAILAVEERPDIDWAKVDALCDQTLERLNTEEQPDYPYDVVYHFLDDADIRRKDAGYAAVQRERLKNWLGSSPS